MAPPEKARAQSAQTVNESAGAGLNDSLKIVANTKDVPVAGEDARQEVATSTDNTLRNAPEFSPALINSGTTSGSGPWWATANGNAVKYGRGRGRKPKGNVGGSGTEIENADASGTANREMQAEPLQTPFTSTRSAGDDIWHDWNPDWDKVDAGEIAFADHCNNFSYLARTDTFSYMRRWYQTATLANWMTYTDGFLYPNEAFVPDSSVIVWHYEFDGKNETELKDLLLNDVDRYFGVSGSGISPYFGYSLTDTIPFIELSNGSSCYHETGARVASYYNGTRWSNPGIDGWIVSTDMVMSPFTGEARHYDLWPADSIAKFLAAAYSGNPPGLDPLDYIRYPNPYELAFAFNKDLITEHTNGSAVKIWYEIINKKNAPLGWPTGADGLLLTSHLSPTVYNHVYRRFEVEDTIVPQYYSQVTNRLELKVTYGSPNLKRSIRGGAWRDFYSPLSEAEKLAIDDGVEIRLRDPGDICSGRVLHFATHLVSPIRRRVTIHSSENILKAVPATDVEQYVEGHANFQFVITFAQKPLTVMAHGYYSGRQIELVGTPIGVNTYQYTLRQVTDTYDIYVLPETESDVSNPVISYDDPVRVWSYGNTLYLRSASATNAHVYTINGALWKQIRLNRDDITTVVLERGVYVIKLDDEHHKVIIR
jgi:hypothetical protein